MLPMPRKAYTVFPDIPEETRVELASYHPLLQRLLHYRGVSTGVLAEKFLNPDFDLDLHDPFLLPDMEKAVSRILSAIRNGEKVLIYSDYDADGIPGGVIMREFFEKIGHTNIHNYIPHRHDEGYGLHLEAVESFKEEGVNLIITVDCGIADSSQVARAMELGMDVIITDHHEPGEVIPKAFAIIDPKLLDSQYPESILCGSGVAFKLIQAILLKDRFGMKEGHEKWFLDLVGIATLSDMVPLVGENRALGHYGLKVIQKSPRPGLQKIWKKLGVDQRLVTEDDIGFSLAPRINAASRMGHPHDAFKLLKTYDHSEADEAAIQLEKVNDERKGAVAALVKDIRKHIKERETLGALPDVLVLGNPEWKPSLLGLAANSILDDFGKPIFLWGRNGDSVLKGSCRSEGITDVMELMQATEGAFTQFGGHTMAGGFAVNHENIHTLEDKLNLAYRSLSKDTHDQTVFLDGELQAGDVTWDTYRHIEKLAPFGVGNPKPVFRIVNALVLEVKLFGKEKNHVEVSFDRQGKPLKAISFFSKPDQFTVEPKPGLTVNVIGTLEKSNFRSFPELRLRIVDIM